MRFFFLLLLLIVSTATAFSADSLEIDTIVIKGSKEKKKYKDTTSSVTVLKDDVYKEAVQDNSITALNGQPNVQVNQNGETYSIRGINNTGVTGYQKDNLASIIIDDVFQTDLAIKAGSFDLWDMERVEVHRGAQSTTQGVNSLAGTILMSHNEPSFFREGKLKLGYASFNRKEVGVVTNNEIISGVLTSRISYNKEASDGYITNVTTNNKKWGYKNKDNLNAAFLYQVSDSDKLIFDLKILRNKNGGTYVQSSNPFAHQVSEDTDYGLKTINQQASVRHIKKINEQLSNTLIVAFSKSRSDELSDGDGSPQDLAGRRIEDHEDQFMSVENLLYFKNEKISNTLGINLHNYKLLDHYNFKILYPLGGGLTTPLSVLQDTKKVRTVYSLFDSFNYDFNESHTVNVGGRFEVTQNKYGTYVMPTRNQNLGATANNTIDTYLNKSKGSYGDEDTSSMFLPKLGYIFHMDNNHFGVSYTEAYRTGGLSINRSRAQAVKYDPEKTNNYEISHKYEAGRFNISSNAFYTNWKKQQVQVSLSKDFYDTQVANASRSEVFGAEVQGGVKINEMNSVSLSGGYVNTRFVDFEKNGVVYTGKQFPNAPHVTSMLTYKLSLNDQLSFAAIGRYLSRSYSNAENTRRSPDQYYIDLTSQYAFSTYAIEFFVKNIFDKEYLTYDGSPTSTVMGASGAYQVNYYQINTPRELGVRVNYFW